MVWTVTIMTKKMIGIYSFPKSGNTWMRHIISALYPDELSDLSCIPDCHQGPVLDATAVAVPKFGPAGFYKAHLASPLINSGGSQIDNAAFICIIRHPLDVFLSYLNFLRKEVGGTKTASMTHIPVESAVQTIESGEVDLYLSAFILYGTLQPTFQAAGSWFRNVESWQAAAKAGQKPVFIIKYEDLLAGSEGAYADLADFLGFQSSDISDAVIRANAKTSQDGKFFWKKTAGHYKEMLPEDLIQKFDRFHGDRVRKIGYEI